MDECLVRVYRVAELTGQVAFPKIVMTVHAPSKSGWSAGSVCAGFLCFVGVTCAGFAVVCVKGILSHNFP